MGPPSGEQPCPCRLKGAKFVKFLSKRRHARIRMGLIGRLRKPMPTGHRALGHRLQRSLVSFRVVLDEKSQKGDQLPEDSFGYLFGRHVVQPPFSVLRSGEIDTGALPRTFALYQQLRLRQAVGQIALKRSHVRSKFGFSPQRSDRLCPTSDEFKHLLSEVGRPENRPQRARGRVVSESSSADNS